jgi:alkylated DNA repair dioxygenase AlkB
VTDTATDQRDLFGDRSVVPAGFRYRAELIAPDEERRLLDEIARLPFKNFQFHGYEGKRRVVSYGWRYDFNTRVLERTEDIPAFLLEVRNTAATFADVAPNDLQQVLVTEYGAGSGIGWHRDKAVFGDVIGVSLLSSCVFRLRRNFGKGWQRYSTIVEPRSAYLLRGPSRTEWEHSIPEVDSTRYSITFRNFRVT